jgi:hypothetical protein
LAEPPPDEPHETGRGKIAAIGVIVVLIGAGLWLVHRLGEAAAVQDCVATGRMNCGQPGTDTR